MVGGLLALCIAGYIVIVTHDEYVTLRREAAVGDYTILQGVTTNFVPEGEGGHPMEQFTLNGVRFIYASYEVTPAFHWTTRKGGPMRGGISVRVREHEGRILRLEVASP